ncbi:DNA cytosine methyltransferase [Mesorhizobium sp. Pch-S]|uniref:DNA cytosine methyltransferase n=1 Tax=Mesorhizobium sp. Pch-S TaxID=2082387 RepID=UPI001012AFA3|nr:DNA cytosine methyltransferase [Mesorhizobium sp. Pch-S]QAZ45936.1 DNA methyltransferase [Mesorhizobium sp. Pch-S]
MTVTNIDIEFRHFHLFCGLGGGAKGFNKGTARVGSLKARFRCIGGIDVDPASIRDFSRAAKVEGTVRDLFDEDQYRAFHGEAPPPGWRPAMPADIRRAAHGERPHVVFLSAPCKGFSGLLPEKSSMTDKYQALNGLTLRGVWLMLEAWKDHPEGLPELIIFENVPRIMTRGRFLIDQIVALLRAYGYAVAETTHDCGEIGGLGQSRKRYLLVARHEAKVPPFLYEPEKRRLRGVGEILERLPLPGDLRAGPMHRLPALQWKTWVRLAFVEAGSDWRSLNKLAIENGSLRDFGIMPDHEWQAGVLGVRQWLDTSGVVAGRSSPTNGAFSVADPRPENFPADRGGLLGVGKWAETASLITSQRSPQQGRYSVADPRFVGRENQQYGVRQWDRPSGALTSQSTPGGGTFSVADPRMEGKPRFNNVFRIVPWAGTSPAVAGPGGPAGGLAVADPRAEADATYQQTKYRVTGYKEPAGTVIAASTTGNGAFAVADPRPVDDLRSGAHGVRKWGETSGTVQGESLPSNGAFAVADPRPGKATEDLQGNWYVNPFDQAPHAVVGNRKSGASAVADPRPGYGENTHQNILSVGAWEKHSKAATGATHVAGGALSVADPRPAAFGDKRENYQTGGHYGVVPWKGTAYAVPGFAKHDRGNWSVADPRETEAEPLFELPKPDDRLVAVIRALDGTWHRPFTTLELAALQSLVDPDEVAEGYSLDGQSDSAWRERIGNAVPPDAAEAIAGVMGTTLLLAMTGETFMLSSQPIWVREIATALATDQRGNIPWEAAE